MGIDPRQQGQWVRNLLGSRHGDKAAWILDMYKAAGMGIDQAA